MLFPWSRAARRQELLAAPFPVDWRGYLRSNVAHYARLTSREQARLEDDLRLFVAERDWEGGGGLTVTDEMKVTVAAEACLLVLGLDIDQFTRVESVILYPAAYVGTTRTTEPGRVVTETPTPRGGEASSSGLVVLSWADVRTGARGWAGAGNPVIHEFAHVLDFRDGAFDGVPRLHDGAEYDRWAEVMAAEYQALVDDLQEARPTLLDAYAATNAAEFFAVATEHFFQQPRAMAQVKPDLYDVLRGFYRQDPAARVPS